ncbi:MAG: CvpA family protein [Zymomonas mobilis]|uniref:Putative membrane protein required for colicin V production n=1 Tax=Zymomonas mobilis TaxID=542 RepID=A0A542W0F1_ZYMMB|nr:CvpA family protein [Zymomonas mobilis]TQL17061.1 putative membrane protein required for colicin V production [Zymomonas mobilis]
MTNFHPVDLAIIALLIISGFMGFWRGFIGAALSLFAWVAAIIAVRIGHVSGANIIHNWLGVGVFGSNLISFVLLFVSVYFVGQWLSDSIGAKVRRSFLAFPDRVLGAGFGAIKGAIIAECLFLVIILINATFSSNYKHRVPLWLESAVSYPWLQNGSTAILDYTGIPDPNWIGQHIRQNSKTETTSWPMDKVAAYKKRMMSKPIEAAFFPSDDGDSDKTSETVSPDPKKKIHNKKPPLKSE